MDASASVQGSSMLDLVFVIAGLGFFAALQLYALGCERLVELKP